MTLQNTVPFCAGRVLGRNSVPLFKLKSCATVVRTCYNLAKLEPHLLNIIAGRQYEIGRAAYRLDKSQ